VCSKINFKDDEWVLGLLWNGGHSRTLGNHSLTYSFRVSHSLPTHLLPHSPAPHSLKPL